MLRAKEKDAIVPIGQVLAVLLLISQVVLQELPVDAASMLNHMKAVHAE